MMNFSRIALHLLKREIKFQTGVPKPSDFVTVIAHFTRANFTTESGGTATLDQNKENKGAFIPKDELVSWVNRLHKEGKHEHALKIFDYMDEKKIEFSPSDLALYVEILAKVEGLAVAYKYFRKVDPDFNDQDFHAKNRPAYGTLMRLTWEGYRKRGLNPLIFTIPCK